MCCMYFCMDCAFFSTTDLIADLALNKWLDYRSPEIPSRLNGLRTDEPKMLKNSSFHLCYFVSDRNVVLDYFEMSFYNKIHIANG